MVCLLCGAVIEMLFSHSAILIDLLFMHIPYFSIFMPLALFYFQILYNFRTHNLTFVTSLDAEMKVFNRAI